MPRKRSNAHSPEEKKMDEKLEVTADNVELAQDYAEESPEDIEVVESKSADETKVIVLEDGFSAQGRNYSAGDEITFTKGELSRTITTSGRSWTDLDEEAQIKRYGKVMFRKETSRG